MWGDKILDEYYRNGEAFLLTISENKDSKLWLSPLESDVKIDDDFIRENFKKPVINLVGNINLGDNDTEEDVVKSIRKYFDLSGRTKNILDKSFFNTKIGNCSFCGKKTQVFNHLVYIFPFVRKIDSIMPDNNKLRFCKECGFKLYSGMAYFYKKGPEIRFFFDSHDYEKLNRINEFFGGRDLDIRDPNNFNKIRKFKGFPTYHPYDTILVIFFEFIKRLKEKNLFMELGDISSDFRLILLKGSKQFYSYEIIEGDVLNKLATFFNDLIVSGEEIHKNSDNEALKKIVPGDLVFSGFFNNLFVDAGKFSESSRKRNNFTKSLFEGKIDFIKLNEIFMERKKQNKRLPFHYKTFVSQYMEVFNLDKESFERINKMGYALGIKMKGTNLENFVWDIFRTRGLEQFFSSLVELQAKLKINMDLRSINQYEKGWRESKAILLNGMLNAIYGGGS